MLTAKKHRRIKVNVILLKSRKIFQNVVHQTIETPANRECIEIARLVRDWNGNTATEGNTSM